jgi:ubiquinone/menaquinone biosynthesis C-methylase UbiE
MTTIAEFYSRPDQLDAFGATYLEWPEIMLLHELAEDRLEMLDLGIGAGRTSVFFKPIAKRYVGVDIAEGMIERCRQRFDGLGNKENLSLEVADATNLREFEDASFDVVLFSFNGLDCVPESGRDDCFRSIMRVLRPGGRFVFSAHNLRFVDHYYEMKKCRGPRSLNIELRRLSMNKKVNGPVEALLARDQVSFWDGFYADQPELKHVFVKPEHQVNELKRLGFSDVRVVSRKNGRTIDTGEMTKTREPWVYFFCRRPA